MRETSHTTSLTATFVTLQQKRSCNTANIFLQWKQIHLRSALIYAIYHAYAYTWDLEYDAVQSGMGTAVAQWLRCRATNRKFAGSIPAGGSGFFIDIKSFRSHWPWGWLSLWVFRGGKGGRCVRLTTYHHPVPLSQNLGTLTYWNPLGLSRPVTGLLYLYLLQYGINSPTFR